MVEQLPQLGSRAVSFRSEVDGGTNASNGTFQIPPIHHEWNKDTPMVPSSYEPVQPRPDWYQALEAGVPGVHFPVPGIEED